MSHHRAWVEVDLRRLRQNVRNLAAHIAPSQVAAVVKSEAYGHGMVPVALALQDEPIWGVCVVTPSEGVRLRQAGFAKPILVVGASFEPEFAEAVESDLTLAIYDVDQARGLSDAAVRLGKTARAHLKFDTGLSRLAVTTDKAVAYYKAVSGLPNIVLEGAYSHLADAEGLDQTYTLLQYRRFKRCLETLTEHDFQPRLRHIAASAAGILLEQTRLDLVRFGISLYGYWPAEQTRILHYASSNDLPDRLRQEFLDREQPALEPLFAPALSYRARIVQTKWIPEGESVGYGCTYTTRRRTRIAVLPVGYAEGYDRHLSNKSEVLICGRRARLLGRVCMNLIVVDVTDIPQAHQGDVATLIGRDGDAHIPAEELADLVGTIQYEFVTRIPSSIPRHYLDS